MVGNSFSLIFLLLNFSAIWSGSVSSVFVFVHSPRARLSLRVRGVFLLNCRI